MTKNVAQKSEVITKKSLQHMAQKCVDDEEHKAQVVIQRVKDKHAREAIKIAEHTAINARKEKRIVKKQVKNLAKAERLVRL